MSLHTSEKTKLKIYLNFVTFLTVFILFMPKTFVSFLLIHDSVQRFRLMATNERRCVREPRQSLTKSKQQHVRRVTV